MVCARLTNMSFTVTHFTRLGFYQTDKMSICRTRIVFANDFGYLVRVPTRTNCLKVDLRESRSPWCSLFLTNRLLSIRIPWKMTTRQVTIKT